MKHCAIELIPDHQHQEELKLLVDKKNNVDTSNNLLEFLTELEKELNG